MLDALPNTSMWYLNPVDQHLCVVPLSYGCSIWYLEIPSQNACASRVVLRVTSLHSYYFVHIEYRMYIYYLLVFSGLLTFHIEELTVTFNVNWPSFPHHLVFHECVHSVITILSEPTLLLMVLWVSRAQFQQIDVNLFKFIY